MQSMRVSASQPAAAVAALRGKAGWPVHLRPLGLASAVGGQRLRDRLAHELELAQRRRHHGAADLLWAGGRAGGEQRREAPAAGAGGLLAERACWWFIELWGCAGKLDGCEAGAKA
jgi:hypothetical protein